MSRIGGYTEARQLCGRGGTNLVTCPFTSFTCAPSSYDHHTRQVKNVGSAVKCDQTRFAENGARYEAILEDAA